MRNRRHRSMLDGSQIQLCGRSPTGMSVGESLMKAITDPTRTQGHDPIALSRTNSDSRIEPTSRRLASLPVPDYRCTRIREAAVLRGRARAGTEEQPPTDIALRDSSAGSHQISSAPVHVEPAGALHLPSRRASVSWPAVFRLHRRLALGASLVTVLATLVWVPSAALQAAFLGLSVVVLGLPHGAVDPCNGKLLFAPRYGRRWPIPFVFAYLSLSGLMISLWFANSLVALGLFLLIAGRHFGGDYRYSSPFTNLLLGSSPILLAGSFHPAATAAAYNLLLVDGARLQPGLVAAVSQVGLLILTALACFHLAFRAVAGHRDAESLERTTQDASRYPSLAQPAVDFIALVALFAAAPPLVSFVVYFCFWHSGRHSLQTAATMHPTNPIAGISQFARTAAPLTALTVVALLGAVAAFRATGRALDAAVVTTVFLGLSALTVPHVLLNGLVDRTLGRHDVSV